MKNKLILLFLLIATTLSYSQVVVIKNTDRQKLTKEIVGDSIVLNLENSTSVSLPIGAVYTASTGLSLSGANAFSLAQSVEDRIALNDYKVGITTGQASAIALNTDKVGLTDGSVTTARLADNAVNTVKILNGAVTSNKLNNTGVSSGSYTNATITVGIDGRISAAANGEAGGAATYAVNVISTNTTATSGGLYIFTTDATLTLPVAPTAGDWVEVSNLSETPSPIIARNGKKIVGLEENLTIDTAYAGFRLVFTGDALGWTIIGQ
jgi:hypothetical protein